MRLNAFELTKLYKEWTMTYHDKKEFNSGKQVLL